MTDSRLIRVQTPQAVPYTPGIAQTGVGTTSIPSTTETFGATKRSPVLAKQQISEMSTAIPKAKLTSDLNQIAQEPIVAQAKSLKSSFTQKDWATYRKALKLWLSDTDAIFAVDAFNRKESAPQESTGIFKDAHADEWIIEQTAKAPFRAVWNVAKGVVSGAETAFAGGVNLLEKGIQSATGKKLPGYEQSVLTKAAGTWPTPTIEESVASNITAIPAGVSRTAFNMFKAPISAGISLGAELPGAQYPMQLFSKGIEETGKGLGQLVGDEQVGANVVETGLNVLGTRVKGRGTQDVVQAFKEGGTTSALKRAATDIGKTTWEVVALPAVVPYQVGKSILKSRKPAVEAAIPAKNVFGESITPVEIEQPGVLGKAIHKVADIFPGEKDVGRLVNDALKTKQRGATPKDRLAKISGKGYVEDLETLHGIVSSGKIEADLNTVFGGAEAVQKGLQHYGQKIGQALKDSGLDSKVEVGTAISKLDDILADAREALANPAMIAMAQKYKQLLTDFPELENIQKTKQDIFQDLGNIRKENVGRQSYRDFTDAAQELITAIDKKVEQATANSAEFINDKRIYKSLKNIEKDITDSAIVAQRGSQQRMVEQLADLQIGLDAVRNPLGAVTAKMGRDVASAIADRNSRDGSFRRAMEIFNERAKKRGDISAKIEKRPESAPLKGTASTLKRKEAPAPRSLDSIIKETDGVDMDKYLSNASEASANKMADHSYKYAVDSAVEGKNTLDFDKIAKIGEAIETGKEGKMGTVGDMIKDSYLRKLYKDALDTPIEVVKGTGTEWSVGEFVISGPKKGTIVFRAGSENTTYNLADTLLHEAAHAIRLKKGRAMENDYLPTGKKIGKVLTLKKGGNTAEINENNTEALKLAKDNGYKVVEEGKALQRILTESKPPLKRITSEDMRRAAFPEQYQKLKYVPDTERSPKPQEFVDSKNVEASEWNDIKDMRKAETKTAHVGTNEHIDRLKKQIQSGTPVSPIRVRLHHDNTWKWFEIIDGHHRMAALDELGIKRIPIIYDETSVKRLNWEYPPPVSEKKYWPEMSKSKSKPIVNRKKK